MQWLIFSHIFYDVSTLTWTNYHKFSFVSEKNQMFFQNKNCIQSLQDYYKSQRTSSCAVGSNISHSQKAKEPSGSKSPPVSLQSPS